MVILAFSTRETGQPALAFSAAFAKAFAGTAQPAAPPLLYDGVTTAAGLAAAIPAVIFYNHFLQNIRDLAQRLDTFSLEVTALIEKALT